LKGPHFGGGLSLSGCTNQYSATLA
jgi:hypothetical protein